MKKSLIILVLLISIVSVFYTNSAMLCFADSYDTTVYYETTENLTVCMSNGTAAIVIPYTYYFKVTGENEEYYIITYNNSTFYCLKSDFDSKTSKTSLTEVTNPYYSINLTAPSSELTYYTSDLTTQAGNTKFKSISFIGYIKSELEYYFYISAFDINDNPVKGFVKANDVSTSFSEANISLHPNSAAAKEAEANANAKLAENNLKRNVFFFAICVLCVLTVFLVYKPFKKKGASTAPSTYSSEDDF